MNSPRPSHTLSRRNFLAQSAAWAALCSSRLILAADPAKKSPIIDTHMHVWSGDPQKFPLVHPYNPNNPPPTSIGTQEVLLKEMDEFGITQCVLVQAIYHGWDNLYIAHCLKKHPQKFRGQGLIDPTDPNVADKLEFWMKEHEFSGMRFSPIYYTDKDEWMNGPAHHKLWQKAGELGAIFNYFISTPQLPRLEEMIAKYPKVRIVIDHFARIDLKAVDPLREFEKLTRLAKYPNVWAKVTEMSVISPSGEYPYKDTFPWARRLYDAFGPDRLLWGTGFPGASRVENGRPTLRQELDLFEKEIEFFTVEDKRKILGLNAQKLWGFPELA
jgi:predicted TIM-barrel fold metal-dependent hydrolase